MTIRLRQMLTDRYMALLIPEENCLVLFAKYFSGVMCNVTGYYPGPVTPSTPDGAP